MTKQPSISEKAFACPYCHVYTTQTWFKARAAEAWGTPELITDINVAAVAANSKLEAAERDARVAELKLAVSGSVLLGGEWETYFKTRQLLNIAISKCFNCGLVALWKRDQMLYPISTSADQASSDLPPACLPDYEEARIIAAISPRGAAALLRLTLQKLCKELGGQGADLNRDIGTLVANGLDTRVQRALDAVRCIGNEAVHPGTLDLRDDQETALQLFRLINLVCDQMITKPREVDAIYQRIPPEKRKGIEDRDRKKENL